jgi:hypothetical protein
MLDTGAFRIGSATQYVSGDKDNMTIKMGSYTIQDTFETVNGNPVNIFKITGEAGQDILRVANITNNDIGGGVYGDLTQDRFKFKNQLKLLEALKIIYLAD